MRTILLTLLFTSVALGQSGKVIGDKSLPANWTTSKVSMTQLGTVEYQTPSLIKETFRAEKLKSAEVKELSMADAELATAQKHMDAVLEAIKKAHGQERCPEPDLGMACNTETTVDIKLGWALIDTHPVDQGYLIMNTRNLTIPQPRCSSSIFEEPSFGVNQSH